MSFDEIYDAYFKDVCLFILRLSGSADIAEEVTSETVFKALKSINSFRGDCSMYTWLCGIAKNCYYSYLKKHPHAIGLDESVPIPDPTQDVESIVSDHDDARRIRLLLHELPETYKEVFMWRVFAEMSFEEIGALFGKSANWACVTYHRARKTISGKMEEKK